MNNKSMRIVLVLVIAGLLLACNGWIPDVTPPPSDAMTAMASSPTSVSDVLVENPEDQIEDQIATARPCPPAGYKPDPIQFDMRIEHNSKVYYLGNHAESLYLTSEVDSTLLAMKTYSEWEAFSFDPVDESLPPIHAYEFFACNGNVYMHQ